MSLAEIEALYRRPLNELLAESWALRQANFPPRLKLAVPGARHYEVEGFRNTPHRFVGVSLTGRACALRCEHCRGELLAAMHPATTPGALRALADELVAKGCRGLLLSGGANSQGQVPVDGYFEAIAYVKEKGLKVIVHTGLLDTAAARGLKDAGVDQALLDVIGDAKTIKQVRHLHKTPADYAASLAAAKGAGLNVVPHVVIGLHFGQVRGELTALSLIREVGADVIVLVALNPLPGTPMQASPPPTPQVVGRLVALARLLNPRTPVALGCARPSGPAGAALERIAVEAGATALAYPGEGAIAHAQSLGLEIEFDEVCCSLGMVKG
ncbi:MAG: radical SAM protein [Chloroflexi bacterium]|nr:radical SAM protein [Chloroflexota bacterium]